MRIPIDVMDACPFWKVFPDCLFSNQHVLHFFFPINKSAVISTFLQRAIAFLRLLFVAS